ncbi:MAG TPA: 50S ribosomal protein L11 methyltransferase [Bryobacteraceae bacterium]
MYSIRSYVAMMHDTRRIAAYRRALERVVTPDSVVVDIGTGLGVFAFLACQAGARKVYAIDPSDVVAVARELAASNGFSGRIEFIEDYSTKVTLPELADVVVSELAGVVPQFRRHIPIIVDARKRLLKPHAAFIPRSDTMWAAVVSDADVYAKNVPPADPGFGLNIRLACHMAANACGNRCFSEAQLLSTPVQLAVIDYAGVEDPNLRTQVEWNVVRPGNGHGISIWFDRTLADGVYYSTAPGEVEMIYGALFLPWPEPVELAQNDTVQLDLRADLQDDDYVWSWNTKVSSGSRVKRAFRQSEFLSHPHSPSRMQKQSADHVPTLNHEGELDRLVLQLMDGRNAIQDIAQVLAQKFPARFQSAGQAIGYVADLSRKYSL